MDIFERWRWPVREVDDDERQSLGRWLRSSGDERYHAASVVGARIARPPFYRQIDLVQLFVQGADTAAVLYALTWSRDDAPVWLDGSSSSIHVANLRENLALQPGDVAPYLRFFVYFLRASEGPFMLLETAEDLRPGALPDPAFAALQREVRPIDAPDADAPAPWRVTATVAYGEAMFRAIFAVDGDGDVEMQDDEPIGAVAAARLPPYDDLSAAPAARAVPPSAPVGTAPPPDVAASAPADPAAADAPPSDRRTTTEVLRVPLTEAVRQQLGHRLLQRFNVAAGTTGPLDQFLRFVVEFAPVIALESDIPFVEELTLELLDPDRTRFPRRTVVRSARPLPDEGVASLDTSSSGTSMYLLSFHASRRLVDVDWVAHTLALGNAPVMIGCHRFADLPEALRRIVDLTLTVPRLDAARFPAVFAAACGAAPPDGWSEHGGDWARYLVHTDFHAPARLRMTPADAVAYLRECALSRLRVVVPGDTLALEDLAGLGEARDVADELVADVRQAVAGAIPWTAVDRGLLLVGPPGTGKTTLARAIAKAADIKFVPASASAWQAAGHLGEHLRAMRDTFAEARRYAPAILFIDEIDSIGNREKLEGSNAVYQTDVINALLEQMQGMDPAQPVIVLAATNHVDRVDPALRRPGRLDQVVAVPLPNVPGLAQIFALHLREHRAAGNVDDDVSEPAAAELALGSTGADVEFYVRGAARRARLEHRRIRQRDLTAEIMREPSRPNAGRRVPPEELRRTAVHEAGHALSVAHSRADSITLTYVSIVPTLDGAAGWTSYLPDETRQLTRAGALERLRTLLSGHAAELLVYGADGVGAGAGGVERSDLAQATALATDMICRQGLGGRGSLRYSTAPSPRQMRQVEALLARAHQEARALLTRERTAFDAIVAALVARQHVAATDVRALLTGPGRGDRRRASGQGRARAASKRGATRS